MYKLFRPLLFLFSPETIHHLVMHGLKVFYRLPWSKQLSRAFFEVNHPSLHRNLWGIHFKNPVGLAAGFDKNASYTNALFLLGFSFIETGTLTPKSQPGNPKPRLFRLLRDKALINRMGFNNLGVEKAVKLFLKQNHSQGTVGGNLGKNTLTPNDKAPEDYLAVFRALYDSMDYFTVNVSCPNVADLRKLQDTDSLQEILSVLTEERKKKPVYKPVLLKISPDLSNEKIEELLDLVKTYHLDGVVAVNTTTSREGLSLSQKELESIGPGGLSGKPLKKRALEVVRFIKSKVGNTLPVIGVGGVMSAEDATEMLNAGADLIQVYTGLVYEGPFFVRKILKALIHNTGDNPKQRL